MLISVIYRDGKHDMVKDFILNRLIEEEKITRFKRSDGWVDIKTGPLRGMTRPQRYLGPERRTNLLKIDQIIELH